MNTKKRRVLLSLSLVGFLGLTTALSLSDRRTNENQGELEINDIQGITLTNRRFSANPDGTTSLTVNYKINPSDASGFTLDYTASWAEEVKDSYESSTWKDGKEVYDYLGAQINAVSREITLTCKKAFGWQIDFQLICSQNPVIRASLNIDYRRKQTDPGSATFKETQIRDGQTIQFNITKPTFTIGSVGEILDPSPEVAVTFVPSNAFPDEAALIPSINLSGNYDTQNVYYDVNQDGNTDESEKMSTANARAKMAEKVSPYMQSVMKGEVVFSKDKLDKMLSYYSIPYSHGKSKYSLLSGYTTYYNTLRKDDTKGYKGALSYNGNYQETLFFGYDWSASTLSNITIDEKNVEF